MKVVIVAGGTGGHIYPGIAIAEALRQKEPSADILFIGSEEGLEKELVTKAGFKIKLIKARALLRKLSYKAITAPFVAAIGFFQALNFLSKFRPDVLISTGGYASLAAVVAAWLLRIPVFIQEQNYLPGITNWLCFRFAKKVFLSFSGSTKYYPGIVVGNPVRQEIIKADRAQARRKLGLAADKKILLVMGGSQGARTLNKTVVAALPQVKGWEIIHAVGKRDYDLLGAGKLNYSFYRPYPYLYDAADALAAADLAVSRAGATAIAEFCARGLPMILVPFPYSAEGHQDLNAAMLAEAGAAVVVKNADFTAEKFLSLLGGQLDLVGMGKAAGALARINAARIIVENIYE
ncbi:MAG: undecaprenyldiphospho-muramoylpentapeptide beta-N-acetylglucosaminyltransferase [Candidatus Margulisbacteria bacterium]|nr:undecaprenyldiphospho-muramoylpentapeptide beta-N-acetylglucosaminyltransferase [Candidatus Margulisiibacteriota bacterium]